MNQTLLNHKVERIIYRALCRSTGKSYIGQTIHTLEARRRGHESSIKNRDERTCPLFYAALRKYGVGNFEWEILQKCKTKESLDKAEKYWIKKFNTVKPNGYNITEGGIGGWSKGKNHFNFGKHLPKLVRDKIKKTLTGRKQSKSTIDKMKKAITGLKRSEASRKRLSISKLGSNNPRFGKRPWNFGLRFK